MTTSQSTAGPDGARGEERRRGRIREGQLRSLAVLVVLLILFTGANLYWTARIAKSEQQKWCGLLVTLDNADQHQPAPKTQFGRTLVKDFRDLRKGFDCG